MRVWACLQFPRDYPEEMIHQRLTRPTQLIRPDGHREPYIHCNITSLSQDIFGRRIVQLNYQMSDEKKLMRELEIMHGKVLDIQRSDVKQNMVTETNGSGKTEINDLVNETLKYNDIYINHRR